MPQQVIVLGLGRFGSAAAQELERLGHEVLAVDMDARAVEESADHVTQAVRADATDPETLQELGAQDFDAAIVGMSSDERASILITVLLKRMGVGFVLSKAHNSLHGDILAMVGADRVVYPERETGTRVAHSFSMSMVVDYFEVAPGYGLEKLTTIAFAGKTLRELDLRGRNGVIALLLRRGDRVMVNPHPEERLEAGDELTVAGPDERLEKLRA